MKTKLKVFTAALCVSGMTTMSAWAVDGPATPEAHKSVEVSASQNKELEAKVNSLQEEMQSLKKQLKTNSHHTKSTNKHSRKHKQAASATTVDTSNTPPKLSGKELVRMIGEEREYLPFDLEVPGQAFVSTGPYVGVPVQFAGSNLIINSPSVNTDWQLLKIRKGITTQLQAMGGEIFKEPYHSHLLLSGLVEAQAGYLNPGVGNSQTDINITTVALDAFFIGPSNWTLGFVELQYDDATPAGSPYTSNSLYRTSNSRIYVNKAFITIGDLSQSPIYGSIGQFYVPFGVYSSSMVSDTLTKLLARTKARAIQLSYGGDEATEFFASTYIFRGDTHTGSSSNINNGGINVGYQFKQEHLSGKIGGGVLSNLADSGGMQVGTGFNTNEHIVHRVPAYNLRGALSIGEHIDLLAEYVGAAKRFNPNDMSYNNHGAQPWAIDAQASYSFPIFDNKPSSVGIGYGRTQQALAMGIPMNRYSLVFNTSVWRNTLQSLELRRDVNYSSSSTATGAGGTTLATASGKNDNAVTAQFDYYF